MMAENAAFSKNSLEYIIQGMLKVQAFINCCSPDELLEYSAPYRFYTYIYKY